MLFCRENNLNVTDYNVSDLKPNNSLHSTINKI